MKYTLQIDGLPLYLSAKQTLTSCNLVKSKSKAMLFDATTDNPSIKSEYWTLVIQRQTNNNSITFKHEKK